MPIAAIPQGIELRKISAGQQKAVDELLKKQKETSLLNSAIPSTALLVIAAGTGAIYLFRDEIKEWATGLDCETTILLKRNSEPYIVVMPKLEVVE